MTTTIKSVTYTAILAVLAVLTIAPAMVSAQFTAPTNEYGLAETADDGSVVGIIELVLNFILAFLAILAILVIVVAGVIYITSGGNEDRINMAKSWLIYAIVGLVIALLAYVIVQAVVTGLGAGA